MWGLDTLILHVADVGQLFAQINPIPMLQLTIKSNVHLALLDLKRGAESQQGKSSCSVWKGGKKLCESLLLKMSDLLPDPCPVDSTVRKSNREIDCLSAEVGSPRAFDVDSNIPLHIVYFHCRGSQLNLEDRRASPSQLQLCQPHLTEPILTFNLIASQLASLLRSVRSYCTQVHFCFKLDNLASCLPLSVFLLSLATRQNLASSGTS